MNAAVQTLEQRDLIGGLLKEADASHYRTGKPGRTLKGKVIVTSFGDLGTVDHVDNSGTVHMRQYLTGGALDLSYPENFRDGYLIFSAEEAADLFGRGRRIIRKEFGLLEAVGAVT